MEPFRVVASACETIIENDDLGKSRQLPIGLPHIRLIELKIERRQRPAAEHDGRNTGYHRRYAGGDVDFVKPGMNDGGALNRKLVREKQDEIGQQRISWKRRSNRAVVKAGLKGFNLIR